MLIPKIGAALVLAALFGAAPAAPAAERLTLIPAAFQGLWMEQLRQCQPGPTDESWLQIEAGRISFYESSGPVLAVVARGAKEIAVITELSGEGSTWLHPLRLTLDGTGQRLTLETVGVDGAMGRVRCPLP
ncbi:hypothetical protein KBY96_15250 [Cyanobium sp. ATX 6A2]|uniref:hypothetical protein n=1 Tax=Cyanobium sp. ATX 6A2 TaxID=2823700 RepID=UPI0020CDD843|nr:hypothetical protein [Cyanobium sp. ATX 6A2]MCP9889273.1 hypothetical protein [Cyanobium sp. ATX 6A2]